MPTALDGRVRSAHSTVDRVDVVRVRDPLATILRLPACWGGSGPCAPKRPRNRVPAGC